MKSVEKEGEAMTTTAPPMLFETVLNLSRYHREHEKFYAQSPLESAISLQRASRTLKTLADRWRRVEPAEHHPGNPYAGCEDLNEPAAIQQDGVLFLEGEREPAELRNLKRDLATAADDFAATGEWLRQAMMSSWETARALLPQPGLADLLGQRHRIIANDWQNAALATLISRLIHRGLEILDQVELAPEPVRVDLAGPRVVPSYLYSAAELLDRAADLCAESATLVHENEPRWRAFHARVSSLVDPDEPTNGE
jgi:hypothetical protein